MELNDLRIFVATVDAGSFTAAADQLMLSKQFVSRRTMSEVEMTPTRRPSSSSTGRPVRTPRSKMRRISASEVLT